MRSTHPTPRDEITVMGALCLMNQAAPLPEAVLNLDAACDADRSRFRKPFHAKPRKRTTLRKAHFFGSIRADLRDLAGQLPPGSLRDQCEDALADRNADSTRLKVLRQWAQDAWDGKRDPTTGLLPPGAAGLRGRLQ